MIETKNEHEIDETKEIPRLNVGIESNLKSMFFWRVLIVSLESLLQIKERSLEWFLAVALFCGKYNVSTGSFIRMH